MLYYAKSPPRTCAHIKFTHTYMHLKPVIMHVTGAAGGNFECTRDRLMLASDNPSLGLGGDQ